MLKIAVLAPMPRASVSTATEVNAGAFASIRSPYRMLAKELAWKHLRNLVSLTHLSFRISPHLRPYAIWTYLSLNRKRRSGIVRLREGTVAEPDKI